jgi:type II secretory pathway component PulM
MGRKERRRIRRMNRMKHLITVLVIGIFIVASLGCERADQARQALDKAKALKESLEKRAREVQDSAKGVLPEAAKRLLDQKKKESEDQGNGKKEN